MKIWDTRAFGSLDYSKMMRLVVTQLCFGDSHGRISLEPYGYRLEVSMSAVINYKSAACNEYKMSITLGFERLCVCDGQRLIVGVS